MKYNITIQDRSYLVEIEDINTRPVIAYVEGIRFEVLPDANPLGVENLLPAERESQRAAYTIPPQNSSEPAAHEMTAPLPGTVLEVFVKQGDLIEAGQVIAIIEAMKMKNSIRSTRAGKVAEVLVSPMQTVAHKQPLVRFE